MSIYDAIKDAISVAQKADNIELLRQLLDLQRQAQDMQQDLIDLKSENNSLKAEINKDKSMKYDYQEHVFYEYLEDGTKEGPYCPTCWQKNKLTAHLQPWNLDLKCYVCGNVVGDKNANTIDHNYDFVL